MNGPGSEVPVSVLVRSFAVQGSWNYETLIGTGFAYALIPALRRRFDGDREALNRALARHGGLFNSHPYLAPMALGAVARMEMEDTDPALIDRFKTAVRGSLGSLGDRLVWSGWRPACLLLALSAYALGAPGWAAAAGFLVAYNLGHLGLRVWSFRMGVENGVRVGEKLRLSLVVPAQRLFARGGPFLVGVTLPLVLSGGLVRIHVTWPWALAAAAAAAAGLRLGSGLRATVITLLSLLATFGLIVGLIE